jgi:hypothetical protein
MNRVTNKQQNYRLWQSGAFGNKLKAWRSYSEWARSCVLVVLRTLIPGGPCIYNLHTAFVLSKINEWIASGIPEDAIMINEAAPDHDVVLQGEYFNGVLDRPDYFYYSFAKAHMRDALKSEAHHSWGLEVDMLLRRYMTPSSYEDWRVLLDQYPNHVLEVSIYNHCLGDIPGRNALVWEVRIY